MSFVNLCEKSVSRNKKEKVLFCWSLRHSSSFSAPGLLHIMTDVTAYSFFMSCADSRLLFLMTGWWMKDRDSVPGRGHYGVHTGSENDWDSHPRSTEEFFLEDTADEAATFLAVSS